MKLITNLINVKYLTGFSGSSGFVLLKDKAPSLLFTDFRYREIAQKIEKKGGRVPFKFVEMHSGWEKQFLKALGKIKNLEFEAHEMTVEGLSRWKKRLPGLSWKPLKETIEHRRAQKDSEEITLMKKSQDINGRVFEAIKSWIKPGMTEEAVAWQIKVLAHEMGAEDISFTPIVGFGPHSAVPHHHNTDRKLKARDIVLIDMGMKFQGYCSDMTRTFFIGKPSPEQKVVYELVLESQLAGIKAIRTGVQCADVDAAARKVMGEAAKHFGHSLGHGIGLEVHENPSLSGRSKDVLLENMVITVEPGIYLPGRFGVRIEDMGRVTQEGYENFTKVGKEI